LLGDRAQYHARIAERPSFLRMKEVIAPALERLELPAFPDFAAGRATPSFV
jgi:hypothetical protein